MFCQSQKGIAQQTAEKKHAFTVYWGYNRSTYSTSNLHLTGTNYNVIVNNIVAHDRPTAFSAYNYFNIFRITIPQFIGRLTYTYKQKYMIGFGTDHMKYVMDAYQTAIVNGNIGAVNQIDFTGNYQNKPVVLTPDFLSFEHTDGLNYINADARKMWQLWRYKKISVDANAGAGLGVLLPKTNAVVLGNARHDDYHLSGFGLHTAAALRLLLFNKIVVATEAKLGYINMPSIRTTNSSTDNASQQFRFAQVNFGLGYHFFIKNKK
jgi:hypothetical protein